MADSVMMMPPSGTAAASARARAPAVRTRSRGIVMAPMHVRIRSSSPRQRSAASSWGRRGPSAGSKTRGRKRASTARALTSREDPGGQEARLGAEVVDGAGSTGRTGMIPWWGGSFALRQGFGGLWIRSARPPTSAGAGTRVSSSQEFLRGCASRRPGAGRLASASGRRVAGLIGGDRWNARQARAERRTCSSQARRAVSAASASATLFRPPAGAAAAR